MNVPPDPLPELETVDAPERRSPIGWILLAAILALMIGVELVDYLGRKPARSKRPYAQQEAALKLSIRGDRLQRMMGAGGPQGAPVLDSAVSLLAGRRKADAEAAALYAVMRHEQGHALKAEDLTILAKSAEPAYQALARIYAPGDVGEKEMQAAASALPQNKRFLYDVARVHALERAKLPSGRDRLASPAEAWAIVAVTCAACLLIPISLGLWIAALAGGLRNVRAESVPLSPAAADGFALRTGQALVVFVLAGIPLALLGLSGVAAMVPVSATVLVALVVLYQRVPALGRLITLRSAGFTRANLGRNILLGIAAALANLPVALLIGVLGRWFFQFLPEPEHPVSELLARPTPLLVVSILLAAAVFAPLIEETIFRGTLFPAMTSAFRSPVWGAAVSSLAFAAVHPTGIPAWPALAAVGAMGCFLRHRTGSLVPCIAMHATHNFVTIVVALAMT